MLGFVGLGAMGTPMATLLIEAGYPITVFDAAPAAVARVTAAGALTADSPKDVADVADTVFVSLPNAEIVRNVALGEDGLVNGSAMQTYIDVSTTGPAGAREISGALAAAGIACVDAPVSGGPAGAQAGRLTFMLAGSAATLDKVAPLIDVLGATIYRVGEQPGLGQLAKVLNNLVSASCIAITAEACALGVKAGLDAATLLNVVGSSSGSNNAALDKFPKQVLTRDFNHGFRLELMAKDVRLCLEEGRRQGVPMLLGSTVDELWQLADHEQPAGADCTEFVRMIESWSDTTVAGSAVE